MATSASLPAGFSFTSVNGQRCTAIPISVGGGGTSSSTSAVVVSSAAAITTAQTTASIAVSASIIATTSIAGASTSSISSSIASTSSLVVAASAVSVASVVSAASTQIVSAESVPQITSSVVAATSSLPPAISTTSALEAITSSSLDLSLSLTSSIDITASKGTTPTASSSTPVAVAQSEIKTTPAPSLVTTGFSNGSQQSITLSSVTSTATSTKSTESTTGGGISSISQNNAAPVVGGILGALGFVAVIALLLFFLRRRKRHRESFLTPPTSATRDSFYGNEKSGVPINYNDQWGSDAGPPKDRFRTAAAGFGASFIRIGAALKFNVVGSRSDSPSVNLNRGNSQFLEGPIPQHSRSSSTMSGNGRKNSTKDRIVGWWVGFREDLDSKRRARRSKEPDPFVTARVTNEKKAQLNNATPDFSELLGMDDRELQLSAERRRADFDKTNSSGSLTALGSLGLSLGCDPFGDINRSPSDPRANPFADPGSQPTNPFSDPISQPQRSFAKQNTYITDIRRSRGQSVDGTGAPDFLNRPPSNVTGYGGPSSRYPSTIAPTRDSYRDTVFSSFSTNTRRGKRRSDPFDLERPELWSGQYFNPSTSHARQLSHSGQFSITSIRESSNLYPTLASNNVNHPAYTTTKPRSVTQAGRVKSNGTYESKYSSDILSLDQWGDPGPDLGPGGLSSSYNEPVSPMSFESRKSWKIVGKAM